MTKLSVNINKIATLRNARGGAEPSVSEAAKKIQAFGADGITIHPRPDERHITRKDVFDIQPLITTEYNIEGNPTSDFMELVLQVKPHQVTLVPDAPNAITSNAGWDCKTHLQFLQDIISQLAEHKIRSSIFLDPNPEMVEYAKKTGADRIELYTEDFAKQYPTNPERAVEKYRETAKIASEYHLGINAGHDLSLDNIEYFVTQVPDVLEVSIGHALISEALYLGLENTISMYKNRLQKPSIF